MAKKTKTKKKDEKEVEAKSEAEAVKEIVEELIQDLAAIPLVPAPGIVNIPFSRSELATFANLMSICAQTFENLAKQAAEQKDDNASAILSARHQLSSLYASKLISSFSIGEPESRDMH